MMTMMMMMMMIMILTVADLKGYQVPTPLSLLGFDVHIQSKLLEHTPVMGTHSSYQLGCLSRTEG